MKLEDFDFDLPPQLIAQSPTSGRELSKLLSYDGATNHINLFKNIGKFFQKGDVLVLNNSRVIKAQLKVYKGEALIHLNLNKMVRQRDWSAFARPGRKIKINDELKWHGHIFKVLEKREGGEIILEVPFEREEFFALLEKWGEVPLPHYIKKEPSCEGLEV